MALYRKAWAAAWACLAIGGLALGSKVERLAAAELSSYGAVRDFLVAHTNVVELTGENGERVAICPEYQGRVMTSTTGDLQGRSLGWVNTEFIEKGEPDRHFNNYGGEDRLWLGPEGGQFSLWFAPGAEQKLSAWVTPAALNDGAFKIVSGKDDPHYELARAVQFQNAARTQFNLEINREIRLQKVHHFGKLFGAEAQSAVSGGKLKMVGFQTINTITNRGAAMTADKGLISIWSLGQFPAGPRNYVIVPYKDGDSESLGPVVNSDYFGRVPSERLRFSSQAVWFVADGKFRSKIGIPQSRVKPIAGSIDMQRGVLTLIHFTMPTDPTAYSYVNNLWGSQEQPYRGDVFNSYNDGPAEPGRAAMGSFYELETLSPAAQLPTGKSLSHTQTTFHIEGDQASLARVVKAALGVDLKIDQAAANEKSAR